MSETIKSFFVWTDTVTHDRLAMIKSVAKELGGKVQVVADAGSEIEISEQMIQVIRVPEGKVGIRVELPSNDFIKYAMEMYELTRTRE